MVIFTMVVVGLFMIHFLPKIKESVYTYLIGKTKQFNKADKIKDKLDKMSK